MGKILSHDSLYSTILIFEKLRGPEIKDTIVVWDNPTPHSSCVYDTEKDSRYLGQIGDSVLFFAPKIDSLLYNSTYGNIGDYYKVLDICANPILPIKNQLIIGNLTESDTYTIPPRTYKTDSISIQQFKSKYNANGRSLDCDIFVGLHNPTIENPLLSIFPNPSSENISIETTQEISSIRIVDILGAEQFSFNQSSLNTNKLQLNISDLTNGIYFIEVNFITGRRLIHKIVKAQ